MSRPWPYPDLRNGTTVSLTTDSHMGEWSFTQNFLDRAGADMDDLKVASQGFVHAGDLIHWSTPAAPEDATAKQWLADRKAASPAIPQVFVPGNHDLASYVDPMPHRTSSQWATAMGVSSPLTVADMGGVRVLGVAPDDWVNDPVTGWGQMTLSPATMTWLDQQLTAAGSRPCWIAMHSALEDQYGGTAHAEPIAGLQSLIGSHQNCIGVLSGHLHTAYRTNVNHVKSITVGGRRIFTVNGPAGGGRMNGIAVADHQWQSPVISMFVTYLGDAIDVRWRNHLERRWDQGLGGDTVHHITLAA